MPAGPRPVGPPGRRGDVANRGRAPPKVHGAHGTVGRRRRTPELALPRGRRGHPLKEVVGVLPAHLREELGGRLEHALAVLIPLHLVETTPAEAQVVQRSARLGVHLLRFGVLLHRRDDRPDRSNGNDGRSDILVDTQVTYEGASLGLDTLILEVLTHRRHDTHDGSTDRQPVRADVLPGPLGQVPQRPEGLPHHPPVAAVPPHGVGNNYHAPLAPHGRPIHVVVPHEIPHGAAPPLLDGGRLGVGSHRPQHRGGPPRARDHRPSIPLQGQVLQRRASPLLHLGVGRMIAHGRDDAGDGPGSSDCRTALLGPGGFAEGADDPGGVDCGGAGGTEALQVGE
mmetsp:Transcript_53290/g.159575  ORF Transcript_53290/g.159575 Transcript_53290/m.159575 type:complete len:340 (-) Transcript_53290:834-1853(-)